MEEFIRKIFEDEPEFGEIHIKYLKESSKRKTEHLKEFYSDIERKLNKLLDDSSIITDQPDLVICNTKYNLCIEEYIFFYQTGNLSYLTGPLLTLYYKTGIILDIKTYIKDLSGSKFLKKYLFDDTVNCSKQFLEELLPKSKILCYGSRNLNIYLDKYGVGLVTQFKIYDDFNDINKGEFHGFPKGKVHGLTSMVMIGYKIIDEKIYYLLQTSKKSRLFIEIDEEYLIRSGATVYFIKKLNESFENLPKITGKFFNIEYLDKPDGLFDNEI